MSDGLLDTSVVIAADASSLELPPTAAISVVTLAELHAGVLLARDPETRDLRRHRLSAVRGAFAPLPVDEPIAERYGELLALARSQGRAAKATDLLIAATAAVHRCVLYTLDRRQAELARAAGIGVAEA